MNEWFRARPCPVKRLYYLRHSHSWSRKTINNVEGIVEGIVEFHHSEFDH